MPEAGFAKRRGRILFFQASIQPPGGGNSIAAWMIEALQNDHDVEILLWNPPDLDAVNAYFGTSLTKSSFQLRLVPRWWARISGWTKRLFGLRTDLLIRKLVMRAARKIEHEFDIVISASNEIQSTRPALQYIHFPWGYWPRPGAELEWFHRPPGVLRLYYVLADALFHVDRAAIARNRTLVNSSWTRDRFREAYGADSEVRFPPVMIDGPTLALPWNERSDDFVALGRISKEKRLESAIEIVERLRAQGRQSGLHIIGSCQDPAYLHSIRKLMATRPWVTLETDAPRMEVLRILGSHRYGIHAMKEEHFGIAVAEMILTGCIPFVSDDAGPAEIVEGDERLTFGDVGDAVTKIARVLDDRNLQRELREKLAARQSAFTAEGFESRIREIVAEMVEASAGWSRND